MNPHALRRQNLNLVRLPISPHPHRKCPYQSLGWRASRKRGWIYGILTMLRQPFGMTPLFSRNTPFAFYPVRVVFSGMLSGLPITSSAENRVQKAPVTEQVST